MTNAQTIDAFIGWGKPDSPNIACDDTNAHASNLWTVGASDGVALLSYGVPIAFRQGSGQEGSVFVDCFSQWSQTTSAHQSATYREAKASPGVHVHAVDLSTLMDLSGIRTGREPKRRKRRIGATL